MDADQSLFASLHKWSRQQDENFCTEGLIYILKVLIREAPSQAEPVISWLTDGLIGPECRTEKVRIIGQVSGDEGRPDLEISTIGKTAWVEVKVDSWVGPTQLNRYRRMLDSKPGGKRLILLSRGEDDLAEDNRPDCARSWLGLSDKLYHATLRFESRHTKLFFVVEDYLAFLGMKQMKLNAVSPSAARSIMDVGSILSQLRLACRMASLGYKGKYYDAQSWLGYRLEDDAECVGYVGFNLSEPQWLFLHH